MIASKIDARADRGAGGRTDCQLKLHNLLNRALRSMPGAPEGRAAAGAG